MGKSIKINKAALAREHNPEIFSVSSVSSDSFANHKEIARKLKSKNPYTITVIIDTLNPKFWNNKKYVNKTKLSIMTLYKELLYRYFSEEFGQDGGNKLYAKWLDKYRSVWKKERMERELDDYIIENELEPRYKKKILKKYKNHDKLLKPRVEINRERYYDLPYPLNRVDWRNPYDNIFVWDDNGRRVFRKGGSGSSGGRQANSEFIFGFSLINKIKPVKSYLFLYSDDNKLYFIDEFSSLTVPAYDVGSNYFLEIGEQKKIISGVNFLEWESFYKLKEVKVTQRI